jgi:hypothetical protein
MAYHDEKCRPSQLSARGWSTRTGAGLRGWTHTYRGGTPDSDLVPLTDLTSTGTSVTFVPYDIVRGDARLTANDVTSFKWLTILVQQE